MSLEIIEHLKETIEQLNDIHDRVEKINTHFRSIYDASLKDSDEIIAIIDDIRHEADNIRRKTQIRKGISNTISKKDK